MFNYNSRNYKIQLYETVNYFPVKNISIKDCLKIFSRMKTSLVNELLEQANPVLKLGRKSKN